MKHYNKKWATAHLHKGREKELITITTGPDWGGDKSMIGQTRKVIETDGRYWADDGGFYVMGDRSWVVVEEDS